MLDYVTNLCVLVQFLCLSFSNIRLAEFLHLCFLHVGASIRVTYFSADMIQQILSKCGGAWWPSGRVSDSGARGQGFDTYLRHVVFWSKDTCTPRKVLVIPRKRWLCPDMTEKLLTGTLSINTQIYQSVYHLINSPGKA